MHRLEQVGRPASPRTPSRKRHRVTDFQLIEGNPMEHCTRCAERTGHRVLDEHGSEPTCRLCLLVLIGDLTRSGAVVTVVVAQPITATPRKGCST
jgi:hypothetical protein